MKQKIFLLPGFGENERCFRNLHPFLSKYELIHVDYRPVLKKISLLETKPSVMAKNIIQHYNIRENDKLVGHSMGGYFSHVISVEQGNPTCLIGSFTDANKIVRFTEVQAVNHFVTGSGLIKTPLMLSYIQQRNKEAHVRNEMSQIHSNFKTFTNDALLKMSIMSFGEDLPPAPVPTFHIHATDDKVVRPPDAHYHKVRGGHFCLVFHPDEVHEKMEIWLNN
jgi:pimeloyl-ACP methyl ester carboxylesterase